MRGARRETEADSGLHTRVQPHNCAFSLRRHSEEVLITAYALPGTAHGAGDAGEKGISQGVALMGLLCSWRETGSYIIRQVLSDGEK